MRIMIKLLNVALLCAALMPAAACEDDPHDLDFLKDSATDDHGDHDHDQAPDEEDAG